MNKEELDKILSDHRSWVKGGIKGKRACLRGADLNEADLSGADLHEADLRGADLHGADLNGADLNESDLKEADLHGADLRGADLHGADLRGADLRGADLSTANLYHANMSGADLRGADLSFADLLEANLSANLRGANIDRSAWPLWCGSLHPNIDKRIAAQLIYHVLSAMKSCADEPDVAAVLGSEANIRLANQFHRIKECGKIDPPEKGGAK